MEVLLLQRTLRGLGQVRVDGADRDVSKAIGQRLRSRNLWLNTCLIWYSGELPDEEHPYLAKTIESMDIPGRRRRS
jgi:hypothetical protein